MTPRFKWTCSFMGEVEYQVNDDTGQYLIATQSAPSDYHLSICNGDIARRDLLARVGLLRRQYNCDRSIPAATVAAFNAWRLSEHRRVLAELEAQPERYGIIEPESEFRVPPAVCPGAHYVIGPGWTLDATANEYA